MDIDDQITKAGHYVAGRVVTTGATFKVDDPSTGAPLGACPEATTELLDEAMAAARAALPAWSADEPARRRALRTLAAAIDAHASDWSRVLSREAGKLPPGAAMEMRSAAAHARWYAEQPLPVDLVAEDATQRVELVRDPVGVVAAVTPWNGPVVMLVNKLAAAMLAGDTVVAKPSPFTPFTSLLLGQVAGDLVPPGVINVLAGGDELGAAMTRHPETDMVAFTGSQAAGRAIMAAAAPTLKRLLLELGGNDAAIVLPDADPDEIAPKLYRGAFANSGQICVAIKRLYVHEDLYDGIVERLVDLARAARVGSPLEEGVTMGPLATRPQFERVCGLVEDALAGGGTAVTGGAPLDRPGYFYSPTIVTGVGRGVALVDEEQFGPVLPVMPFRDVDAAIEDANATAYGLGGSVWTGDVAAGKELARRLRAGTAWVNRHPAVGAAVPFGGMKQSGLGREGGAPGIDAFCELKTVSVALA